MAAVPDAGAAGLPSPRSPTLSVADMILPEPPARSFSPNPYIERPPSPPTLQYSHPNHSATTITLTPAPAGRRGPSLKSPPLSSQSSRSTLRTMGDSDGSGSSRRSGGRRVHDDALASSPTINAALGSHPPNKWDIKPQRRSSNASSSVHSDDLENIKWSGFDDSGVALEEDEEEERDQFPTDVNAEDDDADNDHWLDSQSDVDEDMYSSAALSKRAEMILANAKKRLNVMEGNLRGARQSLVISPTFNHLSMSNELSQQLALSRERDRRLYAGLGPIPPRSKPYYSSPLSASPGHTRGLSETTYSPTYASRILPNKRASSALGTTRQPWSPEGSGYGRFPIRGSRSYEAMREPQYIVPPAHEEQDMPTFESRGSKSPPNLETLPEDSSPRLHRSASNTSDLRSQMHDLKGRISSLKIRAQEDNMRRRSIQSLRTPSPFTCAETWYSEAEAYKSGGSPVSADAGIGITMESPVRKTLYEDESSSASTPKLLSSKSKSSENLSPKKAGQSPNQFDAVAPKDVQATVGAGQADRTQPDWDLDIPESDSHYEKQLGSGIAGPPDYNEDPLEYDTDDGDFMSLDGDDLEATGESVYEDAVYEMPVTERHEDRIDAFDYENFFLHSAMGTYGLESRRSSSSGESVATTRPIDNQLRRPESVSSKKRVSMHQRNSSVDSVSTMATFATAAEDLSDDEKNEQMDQFSQQIFPSQHNGAQHYPLLSGTASPGTKPANIVTRANGSTSRGSSPGADVASSLQTSNIYSILLGSPTQEEPKLALSEEEKQLIYSMAASFQQVCASLQSTSGDQYERKEWRRRLYEARRVLNGEESGAFPF